MKALRFLLAAIAAFFIGQAIAQVCEVTQYRWQNRQTNTYDWSFDGSDACHKHAMSNAEWYLTTYASAYSAVTVDGESYTAPTCSYRLRLTSNSGGATSYTGYNTFSIVTRCMDCALGVTNTRHEWAGWLPATDTSPTWEEFYQPNVGSQLTPKVRTIDYCVVHLVQPEGFVAAGPVTNGWVPYSMLWSGQTQGTPATPNDYPFVIPAAPPEPPTTPGDSDGDGIPDDEETDGVTPLQCGAPPDFYSEKYPDGIAGVWDHIKASFEASSLRSFLTYLVPNYQGYECGPTFSITMMDDSIHQIEIPCQVWTFIKACMLISAMFFAVRLIFGGA